MDVVHRYLELGLRLGRHVEGLVDAYFGPPELRARVEAEKLRPPGGLAADAELLRAEVDEESAIEPHRRAWLGDQLLGIATYARGIGGETLPYADEVERCFGVRPHRTPEHVFADALERLGELLPGDDALVTRYEEWRRTQIVPADAMLAVFSALRAILREATARRFGLPEDEDVVTELARDEPWLAYNFYLGGRRSRIAVNVDLPLAASELVDLVAHEAYPGHHTEHAWKEDLLVSNGVLEESLILVPTPQSMVSEGIAETAWELVADESRDAVEAAFADAGVEVDVDRALEMAEARRPLRFVGLNVALMLHEDGATGEEAAAYTERWAARTPEHAASAVRFTLDPLWRSYVATYSLGGDLCRRHVAGDPERFGALLMRQTRVADIVSTASVP